MKLTGEQIYRKFGRAKSRRAEWESLWQDIYDYVLPARRGFYADTPGEERMEDIFDETALTALAEFVSNIEAGMIPSFSQWFALDPGSEVVEFSEDDRGALSEVTQYVWRTLHNSNFQTESQELITDLSVGWATQAINEGIDGQLITFKTVPQPHAYWCAGPYKRVGGVMRARAAMKIADIMTVWPDAKLSESLMTKMTNDPDAKTDLIEYSYRDYDVVGQLYRYQICACEDKSLIIDQEESGLGANQFVTPRWSVGSGETYGRGPLVNALPAIRTVNLVQQMTLENGQMAISGIWQMDHDGIVNIDNVEIMPGAVYARDPDSRGLERTEAGGDFNVANLIISNMQENIRRALFAENLGSLERTPRSATEIQARSRTRADQLGSNNGRLMSEWIVPTIQRVVFLLKKAGKIELPKIDGRTIQVTSQSPLARGQRFEEIDRIRGFAGDAISLGGEQMAMAKINSEAMIEELARNWEVSPKLLRTSAQMKQFTEQAADMMASMQQGDQPPA